MRGPLELIGQSLLPLFILVGSACTQEKLTVKMDLYLPAAGEDNALWINVSYIDGGMTRKEIHTTSSASDAYLNWQERSSSDNGKTWSDLKVLEQVTQQLPEGGMVIYPGGYTYDPVLDILYQKSMRGLWPGEEIYHYERGYNYSYHSIIIENGQDKELKYEPGPDFDPENPFDSTYCRTNWAEFGQRVVVDKDGTAYFPLVCSRSGEENVINYGGVVLMRRDPASGEWSASNRQFISPNVSSRRLLEPDVAILRNGNLLLVCRVVMLKASPILPTRILCKVGNGICSHRMGAGPFHRWTKAKGVWPLRWSKFILC